MGHVVLVFRGFVSKAEELSKYGGMVFSEKGPTRTSNPYYKAYTDTVWTLLLSLDMLRVYRLPSEQVACVKKYIDKWQRACDLHLWKIVCGHSNAVPAETIALMQVEIEKMRSFLARLFNVPVTAA